MSKPPSERTRVRREPERGVYGREAIDAILDEGLYCHFGFVHEGQPFVIPTLYARAGDELYVHGSSASRMLRTLAGGVPACLTVTLVDGLVLARSLYNHSLNYRSVVVLGTATLVADPAGKLRALEAFSEQLVPGRWREARQPSAKELKATAVLAMPLAEASAKVRSGPPVDEPEDYDLPVWAGVIPLSLVAGEPEADPRLAAGPAPPVWRRPGTARNPSLRV